MPFTIVRNDITKMSTDVIVNTANPLLVVGEGTDHARECCHYRGINLYLFNAGEDLLGSNAA